MSSPFSYFPPAPTICGLLCGGGQTQSYLRARQTIICLVQEVISLGNYNATA